jgi:adenylate cyclase
MTAIAACRTCGTEPLENARFCHGCGSPVEDAGIRAEYKQVTVLFADVVRSMDIAAAVGPERLREMMAGLVDRAAAVVKRYDGTLDKFTGDGIMALFGAPVALEDHALRACRAALEIHSAVSDLADEVSRRDGVELQLRIGLNSGQVIAGEIGTTATGYTAIGEQVGMAQRMQSVAPPSGVMLSASTARLVDGAVTLGDPELVHIKGSDQPVAAQQLMGVSDRDRPTAGPEAALVGRHWEMAAVEGLLDRAIDGHGAVVTVVGSPGIGKSRLVREVAAIARRRKVEVFTTFCESHATDVPFRVVARLLRAATGVEGLDAEAARAQVRARVRDADPEDLLLLDDLLGIADPKAALPRIDPDARRRRLTALVNAASLARKAPALYVIEDAHWIDEVSESMLADFLSVIPQTPLLVLITYRAEYLGGSAHVEDAQTITLAPLSDSETAALVSARLGPHPTVGGLGQTITYRAAGNPFFAEEMVRDLAERGVLRGEPGAYLSTAEVAEVSVPATLQATIAARIDRLDPKAKRTLSAAAVIGSRFTPELLAAVGIQPVVVEELLRGEFVDQVRFTSRREYVFHHPLIHAVAYEAQLKADRAGLHRRVATAIEDQQPGSIDENAALIADHLEAAADLLAAYAWHMRAGMWLTKRDFAAARLSWQRAARVADALAAEAPGRTASRIAPRTMLCLSTWLVGGSVADAGFDELRQLCSGTGEELSMAIAMYGLLTPLTLQLRLREASELASAQIRLCASAADPVSMTGVLSAAMFAKLHAGEVGAADQLAQRVIDLLDGDTTKGTIPGFGSPLAMAHLYRGLAGSCLGRGVWRRDLRRAIAMQRGIDPNPAALVIPMAHGYAFGILTGTISSDEATQQETAEAMQLAEQCGNDVGLALARVTRGLALIRRRDGDRRVCWELLRTGRDALLRQNNVLGAAVADIGLAELNTEAGDFDAAIDTMRQIVDHLFDCGEALALAHAVTALVEALLARASHGDMRSAQDAVERLAAAPIEPGCALNEVALLRLRALLARAHGDAAAYAHFRDRYRDVAKSLGFEGHIAWAEAMP